ncbi:hypothetical protein SIM54_22840 [Bacillus cereus group sp. BfR-BA-02147]|uniref:hypothetical protein n=1 Tax=Bacillus cereus group sp. BfR-BA-02147 TaxID=3094887 RepID=UPI0029C12E1D|nr:hypothetical protein [Bacillus cereus group sp. BfR-BA-02147]MDX5828918.1 hypothetical protein [Bacillus cereus group sp. BfR-BA-02147]
MGKKIKKQSKQNTNKLGRKKKNEKKGNLQKIDTVSKLTLVVQVMALIKTLIEFVNLFL